MDEKRDLMPRSLRNSNQSQEINWDPQSDTMPVVNPW